MFFTKKQESNNTLKRTITDAEKIEFVSKSVSWIEGRNIMDSCFILNFGYRASLPWPQVNLSLRLSKNSILINFNKKVWMRLDDEDTGKGLHLVPESCGMDVPSACTIVIIAGK